jgi:uncharacterized protein (DUF983 family)
VRRGPLFRAFARLAETCERCGLVYRREQGSQTGSMYMTAIAGEVFAVLVVFALWFSFDWSTTRFVLVAMPIVLAFCIAFLPLSQALWVGVEYATDLANREPWAELRSSDARAPEVETVARGLRSALVGKRLGACRVRWRRTLGGLAPRAFEQAVAGTRVRSVGRRAKFLCLELARGRRDAGAYSCTCA